MASVGVPGFAKMEIDTSKTYTLGNNGTSIRIDFTPLGISQGDYPGLRIDLDWKCGSRTGTLEANIPVGYGYVISNRKLPLDMAYGFPNSMSGSVQMIMNCYVRDELRGTAYLSVPVAISQTDAQPTGTMTHEWIKRNVGDGTAYYTNLDGEKLSWNYQTKYGAKVLSVYLKGGELTERTDVKSNTLTFDTIRVAARRSYALTITDSRNLMTRIQISSAVAVYSYTPPTARMEAKRYPDETGTGLQVTITTNKQMKVTLQKRPSGGSWSNIATNVSLSAGANTLTYSGAALSAGSAYEIQGIFADGIKSPFNVQTNVPQAYVYLYLDAKNKALGVGGKPANNEVMISDALALKHGTEDVLSGFDVGSINQGSLKTISGLVSGKTYLLIVNSVNDQSAGGSGMIILNPAANRVNAIGCSGVYVSILSGTSIEISTDNTISVFAIRLDR